MPMKRDFIRTVHYKQLKTLDLTMSCDYVGDCVIEMNEPGKLSSRTLIGFLWSNRMNFAPGLAFAMGRIVAIAAFPIIFKHVVDHSIAAKDQRGIILYAVVVFGLLLLHQYLTTNGASRLGAAVASMILHLRAVIFDKIHDLSFSYLDRQKTGRLLAKYAFDTQKIDGVAMPVLNNFIPNTFYSVVTFTVLLIVNWQLSIVIVLMLPIIGTMRMYYFKRMKTRQKENRIAQEQLAGTAAELLSALRLVRSYGEEDQATEELDQSNQQVAQSRVELIRVNSSFNGFAWGSTQFLTMVVVCGSALLAIHGKVTPGTVVAFLVAMPALVQPIQIFANLSDQYFLGSEAYSSIKELMNEPETEQWRGTRTINPIRGRIEFDNVRFRYPGTERDALSDFLLTIEPGERIALVGPSGAGKSTVANLVLGLYAASAGQIRIDSVPQSELDMRWFRQKTAVVMQESILLSGTIADNIRFARENATDEQVREAARRANAEEFILSTPGGFEAVVGERGVMLSGGQRQRISIARALLRDPAILILDEPTSALDYESERLIQQALDELARGRTVITIAHRLSTIRNADRIIVLHEGRIVETGSFAELWDRGGYFRRILKSQAHERGGTGEVFIDDSEPART
jgi:ABC-type multidrug transport system fused ATPase/permease subunit